MTTLPCEDLAPLIAWIEERSNEKDRRHLSQLRVLLYVVSHLVESRDANLLKKVVASLPIPPVVDMTSSVNEECSISLTCCSYDLFFSLSCLL